MDGVERTFRMSLYVCLYIDFPRLFQNCLETLLLQTDTCNQIVPEEPIILLPDMFLWFLQQNDICLDYKQYEPMLPNII